MVIARCACGRPLHYANPAQRQITERLIAASAPDVEVCVNGRTWLVQRHYLALHGPRDLDKMKFPEILEDGLYLSFLHDAGGVRINTTRMDYANQGFIHTDPTGAKRHFFIPKLQCMADEGIKGIRLVEFGLLEDQMQSVIENQGIEEYHVNTRLTDEILEKPGLMCEWPDGSQLVVDGNHRYVARYRRGKSFMAFWIFPESIWRRALLVSPF